MNDEYGEEEDEEEEEDTQKNSKKKTGKSIYASYEEFAHLLEEGMEDNKDKKFLAKMELGTGSVGKKRFNPRKGKRHGGPNKRFKKH